MNRKRKSVLHKKRPAARLEKRIFVRKNPIEHNLRLAVFHKEWKHVEDVFDWLNNPYNYSLFEDKGRNVELPLIRSKLSSVPRYDWLELRKIINWLQNESYSIHHNKIEYSYIRRPVLKDVQAINHIRRAYDIDAMNIMPNAEMKKAVIGKRIAQLTNNHNNSQNTRDNGRKM